MKNQFFGDINDYMKYGLLRILSGGKRNSASVCWMLTRDTGGPGGKKTEYLLQPDKWANFDHNLFYALHESVIIYGERNVTRAEGDDVLSPEIFSYFKRELPRDLSERRQYFRDFLECAKSKEHDLAFFDPDNGLKTKVSPRERIRSVSFLYLDELKAAFNRGLSMLVIQFLPFAKQLEFVDRRVGQILRGLEVEEIACFRTQHAVFFLIPQAQHSEMMKERSECVNEVWHRKIRVTWHMRELTQGSDQTTPSET